MRMLSGTIIMLTGAVFIAAWMLGTSRNNFPLLYGGILHLMGIGFVIASLTEMPPAPSTAPAGADLSR